MVLISSTLLNGFVMNKNKCIHATTVERAVDNAIVSTQMEGFVITEEIKKLIVKLMNEEITLDEALKQLNDSYNNSIK